jgi:hypothetical protein
MLYYYDETGKPIQFSKTMMSDYTEKLKEVFPLAFREENAIPIEINISPRKKKVVSRFTEDNRQEAIGISTIYSNLRLPVEERAIVVLDGETEETASKRAVRYSRTRPSIDSSGKTTWGKVDLRLHGNKTIDVKTNLDEAIFLYFFSQEMQNGKRAQDGLEWSKTKGAGIFVMPNTQAKKELEKEMFDAELHNLLLNPSTRVDHKTILAADAVMQIGVVGEEDMDRVLYLKSFRGEPARFEKFKRFVENARGKGGKSNDLSELNKKAEEALKAKALSLVKGVWYITTPNGDNLREVCVTNAKKEADQKFDLIEALKKDPETVVFLNNHMESLKQV